MTDVRDYSTTAASNTDKFPEGMAPSAVNDGARALQADFAKLIADSGGTLTLGGTATAYTLTLNTAPAALSDGLFFSATCNTTNTGGATTLVVTPASGSAFASKKIKVHVHGVEIDPPSGAMFQNGHYTFQYDSAADGGTGAYLLLNPASGDKVLSGSFSSVGNVDIVIPSGFDGLELELFNAVVATSTAQLLMRVSVDGSTYPSTNYTYAQSVNNTASAQALNGSTTGGAILFGDSLGNGAANPAHWLFQIPRPSLAGVNKFITFAGAYINNAGTFLNTHGSGYYGGSTSALTNIRIIPSTGNITSLQYILRAKRV